FFQAEDGIRDRNVTGVQTCALPIFGPMAGSKPSCESFRGTKSGLVSLGIYSLQSLHLQTLSSTLVLWNARVMRHHRQSGRRFRSGRALIPHRRLSHRSLKPTRSLMGRRGVLAGVLAGGGLGRGGLFRRLVRVGGWTWGRRSSILR